MICVYFLWFEYWTLKEWKTAKVQSHSVAASLLFAQMIGPLFDMFTGAMFIFSPVRFLIMCKPRTGWPTARILWKWASKLTKLVGIVNAGRLGSIWSEIFFANSSFFKAVLSDRLSVYLELLLSINFEVFIETSNRFPTEEMTFLLLAYGLVITLL